MNGDFVMFLARRTLETALLVAAPALITAVLVGLLSAIFQTVTSIRDMTLGIVAKIGSVGAVLMIFGGWMLQIMVSFAAEVFNHMQAMATG